MLELLGNLSKLFRVISIEFRYWYASANPPNDALNWL